MGSEEEQEPSTLTTHHPHPHLLDWLEDSITFLPTFLEDPYTVPNEIAAPNDLAGYEWWAPDLDLAHLTDTPPVATPDNPTTTSTDSPQLAQPELSKKRKAPSTLAPTHHHRRRITAETEGDGEQDDEGEVQRKPSNAKKTTGKGTGGSSANGGSKDVRWAEQLLNSCAASINAGNLSRVQHLLYVLQELASPSGDVNHRLATHGLRALAHHLSSSTIGAAVSIPSVPAATSFASTEPRLFRSALIRFHEISPWFAFPNALANSSILQLIAAAEHNQRPPRSLHIIDVGVSHGVQWPTLLEAMTRRCPNGAPSLVRLTVAGPTAPPAPFSEAPPGYDFPSHLLRYAKSINLNLKIDEAETLGAPALSIRGNDEALVVCIQFRARQLGQSDEFLKSVRELGPDLVVLTEIDGGADAGGGFAAGFGKRAEVLWRFLDSTSAAFKGRECGERRVMEGEAGRVMEGEAAEGREWWRERMVGAGFREEGFGEEAIDAGRALLRKYDGNWEMRPPAVAPPPEAAATAVGLWWKGQPVSFCSLWKPLS